MFFEEKKRNFRTLFRFLLINFLLTIALSYQYILHSSGFSKLLSGFFIHVALISNFVPIYLLIALFLSLLFFLIANRKIVFTISVMTIFLLHILNFIDVSIFRIWRIHINSMVLNLVFTEGAEDSLHPGLATIVTLAAIMVGLLLLECILISRLHRKLSGKAISKKFIIIVSAAALIVVLADKLTFAVSDLYNRREVTRYSKVFPLYQPLTVKHFMARHFDFRVDREETLAFDRSYSGLDYPKELLQREEQDVYPNIIWILIDAWRYDMMTAELTPNIWEFSQKSILCTNHYSGGNASRFGVFSLFYGIYGYYWHQFLGERRSPVLIDELIHLGYDFKIISSTKLTNPEFRRTAFVKIPGAIVDNLEGGLAAEKDPLLTETFLTWLDTRDTTRPFFSFLFYDAPHGPYSYPPQFEKYTPANRNPNYITVGRKDVVSLKNSYRNAIAFDDFEVGKVLRALQEKGVLQNTVVVISGDHGEEFYESGFWGHTSAFSRQQTGVPLVLYIPGKAPGRIEYLTSHLDVVPTMFDLLGYTSDPCIYSQGHSLLNGQGHDFVVSTGWDNCSIIDQKNTLVFSFETYNLATFEVRDAEYRLVDDEDAVLKERRCNVMAVLKGFREFLK